MTELERGQLLTDEMYLDALEQYGDEFDARMGAEAVREMLIGLGENPDREGLVDMTALLDVQAAATISPLDRILVETDSPYLAPTPHRGKRNRPAWVPHVGHVLADLRGLTADELAAATTANACSSTDPW